MNAYDFAAVANSRDLERATHIVFHEAHERWLKEGRLALTCGQITVLAVETFFGEVLNGGLEQYLGNESGGLANVCAESLERVGLSQYAPVLRAALALFPNGGASEDSSERFWQMDTNFKKHGDDIFDSIEEPFWEAYNGKHLAFRERDREFREKLFAYIVSHEAEFVAR